jgi:RecA-family ATPase
MNHINYPARGTNTDLVGCLNTETALVLTNKGNRLPYLWVTDFLVAEPLRESFAGIFSPEIPPAGKPSGRHIIALDPDAPESLWRKIAYMLLSHGCEVSIMELRIFGEQPLQWHIDSVGVKNTVIDLVTQDISLEEWQKSRANKPLAIEEAVRIAELVLRNLDGLNATIALEELRRRAKVSEFSWDKKYLDQIRQKLERDLANQSSSVEGKPTSRQERLNLEIKALIKENEPIKRLFGVNDIAVRYSLSKADVYQLIREIGRNTETPKCESFSLDEFLSLESEEIEFLVPGMLPRGETVLLAAMPKTGKTLLATDAAFAIATGECDFLGEKVKQGRVLLISTDESPQSTRAKLLKRGFRRGDQLQIMTTWSIGQLNDLEAKLEDFRPDLVVIDSLRRITAGREISENSAEFGDAIYQLKELTGKYGAACILIHHTNKNGDATGLERVRGSTAIAGAVWGTWILDRIPKPDPNNKKKMIIDPADARRVLSVTPRDSQGQTLKIQLNPDNLSFSVCAAESEEEQQAQQQKKTQKQIIFDVLAKAAPKALTGREILEEGDLPHSGYNTLNGMVEERSITQRQSKTDHRSMVYCLNVPPSPPSNEKNMTNSSETTVVESKTNSHEIVTMTKKISHVPEVKNEAHDECNQEPAIGTGDSHVFDTPEGGGGDEPIESPVITPSSLLESDKEVETTPSETIIGDIADVLADESLCDSKEVLAELRRCWKSEDMNRACKRLTPERHAEIKAWVIQLNCENTQGQEIVVGSKVFWDNCPGHWDSWAPFTVEYIREDGMVKLEIVREDWLIPISELRLAK